MKPMDLSNQSNRADAWRNLATTVALIASPIKQIMNLFGEWFSE